MLQPSDLPIPDAQAQAISTRLCAHIEAMIVSSAGKIRFDRYMQSALYEPALGYYLGGAIKFGRDGDFVTAPDVSPMFGQCIARQCAEVLTLVGGDVLEFGGGSGALAASVLPALEALGALPDRYFIVELSPYQRAVQIERIAHLAPTCRQRVHWLESLPSEPINGVLIANEIIDAFPVRRFRTRANEVFESWVERTEAGFAWADYRADAEFSGLIDDRVPPAIRAADIDYRSEINIGIEPWIRDLATTMRQGLALIIDYGHPRTDYYHSERSNGTLMCHFRHRAHADPFLYPGLQDITASVDFTDVAAQADRCGLHVAGFTEQANFLLSSGLPEIFAARSAGADDVERARLSHATKVLTLPNEMGTRFKVLALSKQYNARPSGFQLRDDRHRL